jgi:hypothetical protein
MNGNQKQAGACHSRLQIRDRNELYFFMELDQGFYFVAGYSGEFLLAQEKCSNIRKDPLSATCRPSLPPTLNLTFRIWQSRQIQTPDLPVHLF